MLAGASRSSVNMTVKWDGAPAIFAGVDPEDDKFFVAKKSVFNVSPKLYKTNKEIDDVFKDLNSDALKFQELYYLERQHINLLDKQRCGNFASNQ